MSGCSYAVVDIVLRFTILHCGFADYVEYVNCALA